MNADAIKAAYRRALGEFSPLIIRRYTGTGSNRTRFDATAMGRIVGYDPQELVGSIQQGDSKIILMADDLIDAAFPLPLVKGDKVVDRGKEMNIEAIDDKTRRVGNVLIAYELQVRG